ncbi:MFS transporter [Aurantiacibacter rhizosphaerae]|uniref:MFS transporter n=1 Tax=Aurantiacibacter rhizosphaerae TaxID=2691582 RepID=A0A844XFX7_9SPHN|nr:MFS transporter [Aurantiacibacter rhizosphaerae]MWV28916.1 MFS transporter [Aurantiacibacter rhizosphaerae]
MKNAAMTIDGRAQRAWPSMVENKPLRFAATMILYFMQGVPVGLSMIVLPPWFAANGASALEVGAFIGFATLPWAMKPLAGLFMDRYAYRPMGRRRAWILLAQAAMVAVLIMLAISAPDASEIALLGSFCFALNVCAIFNDVAVDGMTIDLVPIEERGAINGCMMGSQGVGFAVTGYIGGQLVLSGGMAATAFAFAILVAVPSIIVGLFRERPGERLMPWTSGSPSAECEALRQDGWWPMLKAVVGSLAKVRIVVYLLAFFLMMVTWVQIESVGPTLAVKELGWSSDGYSTFGSAVMLGAGLLGIVFTGLLIKWCGIVRLTVVASLVLIVAALIAGTTFSAWEGNTIFMTIFIVQTVTVTLITILMIAWGMMLSNPAVAASQFAVMMAIPNFGRSTMAGASGQVIESFGYGATFFVTAAITTLGLAVFLFAAKGQDGGK